MVAVLELSEVADERRALVAQSCGNLAEQSIPDVLTDSDVQSLCDAAADAVTTMLDGRAASPIMIGACGVDAAAQFDCEAQVAADAGCDCAPQSLEERCTPSYLASRCAGVCAGTCSSECNGGPCTEPGSCQTLCYGECTYGAIDVNCSTELAPFDCDCEAGQTGFERCGDIANLRADCAPFFVDVPENVSTEDAGTLDAWLPSLYDTATLGDMFLQTSGDVVSDLTLVASTLTPSCLAMVGTDLTAAGGTAAQASASLNVAVMAAFQVAGSAGQQP
jgi:hypothetical protein